MKLYYKIIFYVIYYEIITQQIWHFNLLKQQNPIMLLISLKRDRAYIRIAGEFCIQFCWKS